MSPYNMCQQLVYGCIGVQNVSDYAFRFKNLGESPILFLFTEQFCCVDRICSIFLLHVFTGFVFFFFVFFLPCNAFACFFQIQLNCSGLCSTLVCLVILCVFAVHFLNAAQLLTN